MLPCTTRSTSPGGPDVYWTTINAEENLAGVAMPLDLSFWLAPGGKATLGSFADMGVIPQSAVGDDPDDPDERVGSVIYGRYCINLNLVRRLADMTPGTSGDAMETQLFGGCGRGSCRSGRSGAIRW